MNTVPSPSPALLEANRRLYELRMHALAGRPATPADGEARWPEAGLPDHLGWGSQALTRAMRAVLARRGRERGGEAAEGETAARPGGQGDKEETGGDGGSCQRPPAHAGVKHYPSLGLAALKGDDVSAFRVWLAGRYLDRDGRGWLDMQQVRAQLAGEGASLRLCGWRRLRQILGQGDGRYWTWDRERGRLWLFGAA